MFNQCPGLWNSVPFLKDKEKKSRNGITEENKAERMIIQNCLQWKSRKPKSTDVNHKWQCAVINADWKPDPLV